MTSDRVTSKVAWFIAGAAIGTSIALLCAPAAGDETREAISRKTGEGRTSLIESGWNMLERGRDLYERGRQIADQAAELFEQGRKLMEQAPGEGRS